MTRLLASVSRKIPGIIWDKYQQTPFPSNNILLIIDNHAISAVVNRNSSMLSIEKPRTDSLQIPRLWETHPTCSNTRQDSSWVSRSCWLLLILFGHEADYIVLRASHFVSLSSSSPIPQQQIMDTQSPQPGESGSKSSRMAGATSNMAIIGTQQERRHQLVHHDAANAATKHMTHDAHSKIVCKTGSSKNKKQHAVGCENIHIKIKGHQLTIWRTAGVRRELRDQIIAARNG